MSKSIIFTAFAAVTTFSLTALAGWSSARLIQSTAVIETDIGPICQVSTLDGLTYATKLVGLGQTFCESAREAMVQSKLVQFYNRNPDSMSACDKLTYKPKNGFSSQSVCAVDGFSVQR